MLGCPSMGPLRKGGPTGATAPFPPSHRVAPRGARPPNLRNSRSASVGARQPRAGRRPPPRGGGPAATADQHGVEGVVAVQLQRVHQRQRSGRACTSPMAMARLRATTGGGDHQQLVVQGDDLQPIGLLEGRGVSVHGVDGGLELVDAGLVAAKAAADDRLALGDQGPIPSGAVLLAEHQGAVGPFARRGGTRSAATAPAGRPPPARRA